MQSQCYECKSKNTAVDSKEGNVICRNCGLVLERQIIDETFEGKRMKSAECSAIGGGDGARVGTLSYNHMLSDGGLGTTLVTENNRTFVGDDIRSSEDKAIYKGQVAIDVLVDQFSLNRLCRDLALDLYSTVVKAGKVKGRSVNSIVTGAVYVALRYHQGSVSLKDIVRVYNVPRKEVISAYSMIMKLNPLDMQSAKSPIVLVKSYCNKLRLAPNIHISARQISQKVQSSGAFEGRQPATIAGAVLLHAGRGEVTIRQLAKVNHMAESTIMD